MKRHIHNARDLILPVIDFFYPPFKRLMNLQTFRYAASGGFNTVLGFVIYWVSFEFLLKQTTLDLGFYALKAHNAALFISFCICFPIGFFLSKYVVFNDSNIKGRVQLFRYLMICLFNLALNYLLLKVQVETLHLNAVLAEVTTIIVVVIFSYLAQRHFSFKVQADQD